MGTEEAVRWRVWLETPLAGLSVEVWCSDGARWSFPVSRSDAVAKGRELVAVLDAAETLAEAVAVRIGQSGNASLSVRVSRGDAEVYVEEVGGAGLALPWRLGQARAFGDDLRAKGEQIGGGPAASEE